MSRAYTLVVVYDLRDGSAWQTACDHGRTWGRLYADFHALDGGHIAVVFRSGGDRRRAWGIGDDPKGSWPCHALAAPTSKKGAYLDE
jgi:hypothetical protein